MYLPQATNKGRFIRKVATNHGEPGGEPGGSRFPAWFTRWYFSALRDGHTFKALECHANFQWLWVSRLTLKKQPHVILSSHARRPAKKGLEASRNIGHHWTILGKVDLFWTCPQKVSKSERG
jgi:hypothetical protein